MLREITFKVDANPIADRVVDDLHAYSRWADTVEAFGTGAWLTLSV